MIGYSPDTTKHFRVWAPQTKQVIIASEPYIDESEQGAKLLTKWPLDTAPPKQKAPDREPGPRGRPRKHPVAVRLPAETIIKGSNKDSTENEVPTPEVAMSTTEANGKIHEPGSYDEAINDPIHGRR